MNHKEPIIASDLVMRNVPNPKSKLHPKWDGPFVVVDTSDKNTYQLATANGYILRNLINDARIRKLTADERTKYRDEFWNASDRLKLHDKRAEQEQELHDVNKQLKEATLEHLQVQQRQLTGSQPPPASALPNPDLSQVAEISQQKRDLERALKTAWESTSASHPPPEPPRGITKRIRCPPARLRDG